MRWLALALLFTSGISAKEMRIDCEKKWGEITWEGIHFKRYRLRAHDFPPGEEFHLFITNSDGEETQTFRYLCNKKGHLIPQELDHVVGDVYAICPMKRGERLHFYMATEDRNQGCTAAVIPFPLEMESKKGVKLSLELKGQQGKQFVLRAMGLRPYETVQVVYKYDADETGLDVTVGQEGSFETTLMFPEDRDGGPARLFVRRSKEEILFPFEWGTPALKVIGACCLEIR
ncbi:MAG: hypothetical protein JSS61_00940 [Verrucomicrobia bacterium]|nr:hypothetical protein [Verrucomicrobiota bacterium]